MSRQRRRDTEPEIAIRRALHALGYRYRVSSPVAGTRRRADITFPRWKVVVFIDGCFWHSCPLHRTFPKSNREWWLQKLQTNVYRDRDTDSQLRKAGWRVIRIWEHERQKSAVAKIARVVEAARARVL